MPKEENNKVPVNPLEMWEQWYNTTSKIWTQTTNGNKEAYVDPFGLHRAWMKSIENAQEQMQERLKAGSFGYLDPREAWKKWFETTTDIWEKATWRGLDPLGITTQWLEMMEDVRARLLAEANIPADPFTFMKQWYDATSETWATVLGDIIGTEKFMEAAGRFLESYASFYKTFRRANEEFLSNLQVPTRSDIARVAELVIEVEDKVEQIEDAIEDFQDNYTNVVPGDLNERLLLLEKKLDIVSTSTQELTKVDTLEKRLERVESKLDKLLVALEKIEAEEFPGNSKRSTTPGIKARRTPHEPSKDQAPPTETETASRRMK